MNYADIIREMKLEGHYLEAEDLERSLERYGSQYDLVCKRADARDGLDMMSREADLAERAYDHIKERERREEEAQERELFDAMVRQGEREREQQEQL